MSDVTSILSAIERGDPYAAEEILRLRHGTGITSRPSRNPGPGCGKVWRLAPNSRHVKIGKLFIARC
jgi:hypothetical protein